MVVEIRQNVVDGHLLKWLMGAGVLWLDHHKQRVNEMNVFPVPDGDTGTNMLLTIRKAYQQVANFDEHHVGIMAEKIARGALTGARGNSGTILSMLLRGFAHSLKDRDVMDAVAFAQACQNAVDYAYETVRSVMEPVEGTILTVARESAAALNDHVKVENNMRRLLMHMIAAAYKSLENTPNLLPRLKEAGVVDSGGMGLVYILEGMQRFLDGDPVSIDRLDENVAVITSDSWQDALIPEDEEGYGYDVQFLMIGNHLDVNQIRHDISTMGWSPLVDGDETLVKVHIHVHDPGQPLSYAIKLGVDLDDIVVENMQTQYIQYVQDRANRESQDSDNGKQVNGVAVVTVARGDGLRRLFDEYGAARVILGGQTMNPSTEDFLSAIESLTSTDIILLPNNSNVIMAAQQAASLANGRDVRVVPTKTVQQGIASLLAYMDAQDGTPGLDDVYRIMSDGFTHIVSGEITRATRNAVIDNVAVREGDLITMLDGKMIASGNRIIDMARTLLDAATQAEHELVTVYYGDGVTAEDAAHLVDSLRSEYDDFEFEIVYGGQPLYPYLISVE